MAHNAAREKSRSLSGTSERSRQRRELFERAWSFSRPVPRCFWSGCSAIPHSGTKRTIFSGTSVMTQYCPALRAGLFFLVSFIIIRFTQFLVFTGQIMFVFHLQEIQRASNLSDPFCTYVCINFLWYVPSTPARKTPRGRFAQVTKILVECQG